MYSISNRASIVSVNASHLAVCKAQYERPKFGGKHGVTEYIDNNAHSEGSGFLHVLQISISCMQRTPGSQSAAVSRFFFPLSHSIHLHAQYNAPALGLRFGLRCSFSFSSWAMRVEVGV